MLQTYHRMLLMEIRRRLLIECKTRTLKCLDMLTQDEIWYRPNTHSNSVGNLVLHLCGNVQQWLHATMGGEMDSRERQAEFDERGPVEKNVLKDRVVALFQKSEEVLAGLTPEDLMREYLVQGFKETGVAILVHITEHFSYHVGQITYYVKSIKDTDMGYYAGQDLDVVQ